MLIATPMEHWLIPERGILDGNPGEVVASMMSRLGKLDRVTRLVTAKKKDAGG